MSTAAIIFPAFDSGVFLMNDMFVNMPFIFIITSNCKIYCG